MFSIVKLFPLLNDFPFVFLFLRFIFDQKIIANLIKPPKMALTLISSLLLFCVVSSSYSIPMKPVLDQDVHSIVIRETSKTRQDLECSKCIKTVDSARSLLGQLDATEKIKDLFKVLCNGDPMEHACERVTEFWLPEIIRQLSDPTVTPSDICFFVDHCPLWDGGKM